jgi:hypothetical protein
MALMVMMLISRLNRYNSGRDYQRNTNSGLFSQVRRIYIYIKPYHRTNWNHVAPASHQNGNAIFLTELLQQLLWRRRTKK